MNIKNILAKYFGIPVVFLLALNMGCKKAIEVGKSKAIVFSTDAYSSNGGAQAVVAGILTKMSSSNAIFNGPNDISLEMGLASDELFAVNTNSTIAPFYLNTYSALSAPAFWGEIYKELLYCNSAIEGISASSQITANVKTQLMGELKFFRGFLYFYAVNLYGTPPLILTSNYQTNNTIGNSPSGAVYTQIIQDLTDAQTALADNIYVDGSGVKVIDRVRPNKQVATAMLARVYLYIQDWKNAEAQSSAVIANSNYTLTTDLSQAFLRASKEIIWALQPVMTTPPNTVDATYLVVNANLSSNSELPLNTAVTSAFESGDKRFTNWVGTYTTATAPIKTYYYANKYRANLLSGAVTEYPIVLRFAEQYLIRAEARANQSNITGAVSDLNILRARARQTPASLPDYSTGMGPADCLSAIAHERQVELFTEWGHRWFDLKRTGKLDGVMTVAAPAKGTTWNSYKQLMPLPATDLIANPNLKQNQGYN